MREFKFRAWDKHLKEMCPVTSLDTWAHLAHYTLASSGLEKGNYPDEVVLMQYTDLHDKNGKEIYEGDILAWRDASGQSTFLHAVEWRSPKFWLIPLDKWSLEHGAKPMAMYVGSAMCSEVIGNVWEHPDLLKGGEQRG